MAKKVGRPRKEDARRNAMYIRLNDKECAGLKYLSEITGKSKSEILRDCALSAIEKCEKGDV